LVPFRHPWFLFATLGSFSPPLVPFRHPWFLFATLGSSLPSLGFHKARVTEMMAMAFSGKGGEEDSEDAPQTALSGVHSQVSSSQT
jgi:hypothetical protein